MRAVRLLITGQVQGVGYRAWAIDVARRLGLRGWVRNRLDGTVEALVNGPAGKVETMIAACGLGPSAARVATVEVCEAVDDGSLGFTARPTE